MKKKYLRKKEKMGALRIPKCFLEGNYNGMVEKTQLSLYSTVIQLKFMKWFICFSSSNFHHYRRHCRANGRNNPTYRSEAVCRDDIISDSTAPNHRNNAALEAVMVIYSLFQSDSQWHGEALEGLKQKCSQRALLLGVVCEGVRV